MSDAVIFPWRPEYSVGMPAIDAQHRRLVALINDLHTAMRAGKAKDVAAGTVGELLQYTESHFAAEEGMLRQRGYAAIATHRQEHQRLIAEVQKVREELLSGKLSVTLNLMNFLKGWLANHIMGFDQRYARELRAR